MSVSEKIAWRIPFNPSWVDKHEFEEGVCLVKMTGCSARIWAVPRVVEAATYYEPIYMMLVDEEPRIWFEDEPPSDASVGIHIVLEEELAEVVNIRALTEDNTWVNVEAKPHLAVMEVDEVGEEEGICVAYSLPGAEPAPAWGAPNVCDAMPEMMRHVYVDGEPQRQPFFYAWS